MMAADRQGNKGTWKALCFLVILFVELVVCLLLFLPQSEVLRSANRQANMVDEQVRETEKAPELLQKIKGKLEETERTLDALNTFCSPDPAHTIMNAVAESVPKAGVELVALEPDKGGGNRGAGPAELWQLRVRGAFRNLLRLLAEVQKQGVLLHSDGFTLERGKETDLDLSVKLGVWSEQAFRRVTKAGAAK